MKFSSLLFYSVLVLFLALKPTVCGGRTWCWTKSMSNEPNFILNTNIGGLNWGFCQKGDQPAMVKYIAYVETSQIDKSETSSQVKIQMWGEKGKTNQRIFSSSGFERGAEKKVEFTDTDVGKIQKIALTVIGNQGYRCKTITFKMGNQSSTFECLKRIEPCKSGGTDQKKCTLEIEPEGDNPYEVTIKTSEDADAGTKSPILLQIKGVKGETNMKMFSELGLQKGSSETVNLNIRDVGDITGFKLQIGGRGKWKPAMLTLKNLITGMIKNFDIPNAILMSPGSDTYSMNQSDEEEQQKEAETTETGDGPKKQGESGGESSSPDSGSEDKDSINIHNPYGGVIEPAEKKNIIQLTCEQKLLNPSPDEVIFGPDYPTRNINYMKVLAQCPSDCHKVPGTVYGIGIHPDKSPICLSAIVDKAVSLYGGIISISIYPGLDSYKIPDKFPPKMDMISIKSLNSKSVMKSYIVSKVDSLDLVDKDIRIVDNKGNLAAEGRLEFRVDGIWGSVCSVGNTPHSANLICQNLGYRGGEWKVPLNGQLKDFCRNYKGFDYCAANASKIHFEKIECVKTDQHFNTCIKQLANQKVCSHGYDSIINCYNDNYENDMPVPVGVVRLNAFNKEGEAFIGRLEMFNEQEFYPICDLSFNNEAADIACKQMGYIGGEYINDSRAKSYRLENSSKTKFAASNVMCKGSEKALKECNSKLNDIQCKHDQDVVIKCAGLNGDPSGKRQYMPKPITPSPELGKLGLNKVNIKCDVKGNNPFFRGDPGSIYLVECPANCLKEPGMISGTGLYTTDSNICLAAIHSGAIDDASGGVFAYVKSYGQMEYEKSNRFGVLSNAFKSKWAAAFSISQVNTGWMNMHKIFQEGISSDDSVQPKKSSFLQLSNSEAENSIPKPLFQFVEPTPNYIFKDKANFLIESHNLSRLSTYTILTRFKMEKFAGKKEYIFSYSGCEGFNVLIDKEDNLIIGSMCNPKDKLNTRIMIPLNESITLFITYEKGVIDILLKSEKLGEIRRKIKKELEINPAKGIGIGRLGQIEKGIFMGEINFALVFDSILDATMIPVVVEKIKSGGKDSDKIQLTEDGRNCVSPCLDSTPGEGNPPDEARLDANNDSEPPLKDDQGRIIQKKPVKGPESLNDMGTYDKSQENNIETIQLECTSSLMDNRFTGQPGKVFRVHCPVCDDVKAVVFGTGIYHPLSSICRAAMHIGVLEPKTQSDLLVELTGEKDIFTGSEGKDNSISSNFAKSDRSFKVKRADPLRKIACETNAGEDVFQSAPIGAKFVVICPENCSKSKTAEIFGSEVYSDNSAICLAGIHYGVLNDNGGELEFIIEGEQNNFKSTHGFGITSKSKESYIRSFRFLGQKSSLSMKFKEDYQGKLPMKWKNEKLNDILDKSKDSWFYKLVERATPEGQLEKFYSIVHTGTVRAKQKNLFGSYILLKHAEFANGVIKFNLKFLDLNPMGVIFRYTDSENFYGIYFDPKNKLHNVNFFAKINSSLKIIDSKMLIMLRPDAWFRCTLILNCDEMTFLIQQEHVREHRLIFAAKEIKELNRGLLGFGTNGNHNFFISGVDINDYHPNMDKKTLGDAKKTRTFENLLKKTTKRDIKGYCGEIYEKKTPQYIRCNQPHEFCQIKCDSAIPRQEPMINYKCFKDCVKTVYNNNVEFANNVIDQKKWMPKENSKIDFLVNGETTYRPATVTEIIKRMKKTILKIEYNSDDGASITAEIAFPSKNVLRCGEKLPQRRDCNDSDPNK